MTFSLPQLAKFRNLVLFPSAVALILSASTVFAETVSTEEWQISADKVTRYDDPQSIVAEGNIVLLKIRKLPPNPVKKEEVSEWAELLGEKVVKPEVTADEVQTDVTPVLKTEVTIKADWIAYDVVLGNIKARGNIVIEGDEDILYAEKADINLTGETGSFSDAKIIRKDKDLHFEGEEISKTGLNSYHIENGWVITCKLKDNETPPWSLSSNDTTIKPDGYAVMKHAKFNVKGVPIFYTPYMVVPIKSTRQTGFLFPEISSSSNNGFGFNLPFFINISDSTDMTLFPEYYYKRGLMPGLEFRYVQSAGNKGSIMGSYLDDQLTDPSETEYYEDTGFTHTNSDRYWVRGKADHGFSNGVETRFDLDLVSDRDYLTEFNTGITGFQKSHNKFLDTYGRGFQNKTNDQRENSLKFLKSWTGMSLEANFLGINDIREDQSTEQIVVVDEVTGEETLVDPVTDPDALWKLPSIDFTGSQPLGNTSFSLDWDADYVNYWREEGLGGHRFDIFPRISSTVPMGQYLESRAEVGIRDTYYIVKTYGDSEWENGDTQNRLLFDFFTEIETTLVRDFSSSSNTSEGFTHEVRPFVSYAYLPDVDQDDLPYFDSVDSISQKNGITYGIDNFFDLFGGTADREYGYFKIQQTYDFSSSNENDEDFSDVNIKLGWRPLQAMNIVYKTDISVYGDGFATHGLEGTYSNSRDDLFSLDYRFNDAADIDQINGLIRAHLFANWLAEIGVEHSLSQDETIEGNFSLLYQALCWSLEFETRYTPSDTTYMLMFNLANIGIPIGVTM